MKRYPHILTALFLSLLIIFMGAGIPVIQYRYTACAESLWTRIAKDLSLADRPVENPSASSSCPCCKHDTSGQDMPSCSITHIEKLSTPTLTPALQVDGLSLPCMELLFPAVIRLTALIGEGLPGQTLRQIPIKAPPRVYLTRLCTLLI